MPRTTKKPRTAPPAAYVTVLTNVPAVVSTPEPDWSRYEMVSRTLHGPWRTWGLLFEPGNMGRVVVALPEACTQIKADLEQRDRLRGGGTGNYLVTLPRTTMDAVEAAAVRLSTEAGQDGLYTTGDVMAAALDLIFETE